jgi:mannose/fructose/N-acetylgalactosamine-specific phosphotransferase system component IIC
MKSRPAETGAAVAAAVSVLIAWLAHIDDATVIAAMAVVIGFVPAAITWVVTTTRKPTKRRSRAR